MTDRPDAQRLVERLRELVNGTTPGDWLVLRRNHACVDVVIHPDGAAVGDEGRLITSFYDRGHADADAALMLHARRYLPEAADALTQLRAERDALAHDLKNNVQEHFDMQARAETAEAERDATRQLLQGEHMVTQSLRGIKWMEAELLAERERHT